MYNNVINTSDFKKRSEKFMHDPISVINDDINGLRSEINSLTERLIVTEIHLNELVDDYRYRRQFWAKLISDFKLFGLGAIIMSIILLADKVHLIF